MDEPKKCPFCGESVGQTNELSIEMRTECYNPSCWLAGVGMPLEIWQTRPLEDALQARIDALESENAALKAANAWHPASEPPDNSRCVIACNNLEVTECIYSNYKGGYWEDRAGYEMHNVTRWRELPAPPEDAKP